MTYQPVIWLKVKFLSAGSAKLKARDSNLIVSDYDRHKCSLLLSTKLN